MEQLSPNHKRFSSDNLLHASSEDMETEPLSPNQKRVLTRSESARPRMEMGDSSNRGYEQFSEEVVDTSQIKSHSQEISSQTGLDPHLVRFLSDDLENNKGSLETSYPKDSPLYDRFQETKVPASDVDRPEWESSSEIQQQEAPDFEISDVSSLGGELIQPQIHGPPCISDVLSHHSSLPLIQPQIHGPPGISDVVLSNPSRQLYYRRAVSPPLRRRFQRLSSYSEINGSGSVPPSEVGTGSYHYGHRPPSIGDLDEFENDNNANPADLASAKPHSPKPEHGKNPTDETLLKKMENHAISAKLDEVNYTRASNVTISNFVSVKLCGKSNYHMWRTQMECLMRSHNMLGLVDDKKDLPGINKNPELTKRYENLLNGWLIGSLNEEIIKDDRIYDLDAKGIWRTLKKSYDPIRGSTDSILHKKSEEGETRGTEHNTKLKKKLHNATLEGHWWKAKSILEYDVNAATWAINDNGDTLLHVAVREGYNYFLKKLLSIINDGKQIEKANSKGHTALHIAAIVGNEEAAELLVDKRKELLEIEDKKSKKPLACAYLHKQVNAFVYLWKVTHDVREVTLRSIDESLPPKKSEKDTNIEVDERLKVFGTEIFNFLEEKKKEKEKQEKEKQEKQEKEKEKEKQEKEKQKEKEKVNSKSLQDQEKEKQEKEKQEKQEKEKQEKEKKEKKEKFIGKIGESLLHTAIFNKEYDLAKELVKINPGLAHVPGTLVVLTRNFPSQIGFTETLIYPSLNNVCQRLFKRRSLLLHSLEYLSARAGGTLWKMRSFKNKYYCSLIPELVISLLVPAAVVYPIYQLLCLLTLLLLFPFSMLYFILWKALEILVVPIKNIEKNIKEHKEAKKFLKFICNRNSSLEANSSKHFDKFYKESLMEAVRLDVYEVLDQILKLSSDAMKVKNKDGHNIIQLAVINRSQKVYNRISPIIERKGSYRRVMDVFSNNLLHLAGRLAPSVVLSCTTGAALQLQRELQWREEVKKLMEPTQHTDLNVDYETPEMVFSREHANLVKEGEKWMKTTAESCSITAALIITIVFAAAITVPGGSNQDTGIPLFKRKVAFNIFAVADAISLFSASTSLLVFLSILTTRFAEKDFLISLPRRLFAGLCLLFLSTTAMMLAFSTILFLVFCEERLWMLVPIGVLTCFPIAAIVTLQLPLVIDLYQATFITIFGNELNEEDEEEENREEEEDKEKVNEEADKEKPNEEAENEEQAKEEETQKPQIIERDNNSILKRLSMACCLPLHQQNKPIPKRSSTKFCLPLHRGNLKSFHT